MNKKITTQKQQDKQDRLRRQDGKILAQRLCCIYFGSYPAAEGDPAYPVLFSYDIFCLWVIR